MIDTINEKEEKEGKTNSQTDLNHFIWVCVRVWISSKNNNEEKIDKRWLSIVQESIKIKRSLKMFILLARLMIDWNKKATTTIKINKPSPKYMQKKYIFSANINIHKHPGPIQHFKLC